MPSVKMTATKMSDAHVSFISLVERGANRIPFKIMKQENQAMAGAFKGLDLGALFATRKAETPAVEVVGVVTMKGEGYDSVVGQIAEAGFVTDTTVDMGDGSVILKQAGDPEGDGEVIRMGDSALLITKGFRPYSMEVEADGVSFADMVKAQGFYPGVSTALDVARTIILSTAGKADDPVAASKAIGKVMDEFKTYIQSLVAGLPAKAFKLETVFPEEAIKDEAESAGEAQAETSVGEGTQAVKGGGAESEEAPETTSETHTETSAEGKPVEKSEETKEAVLTEESVSAIFASKFDSVMEQFVAKMGEALTTVQKSVETSVAGVNESVKSLSDRVEKAEADAEAAAKTLTEALVGGHDAEDHAPAKKAGVQKSSGREIDTAFMGGARPRHQRR